MIRERKEISIKTTASEVRKRFKRDPVYLHLVYRFGQDNSGTGQE